MKSLKDVCTFLRSIPCINQGGCAISALAMHRWLKFRGEKSEIYFTYASKTDPYFKTNQSFLEGKRPTGTSCLHALLEYNGDFYDCNGTRPNRHNYHIMSENIVVDLINIPKWNESFDRKYIKGIMKKLKIDLTDIDIF